MASWETYLTENQPRFLEELLDVLRIPSISALPEHSADVALAAEWTARRLTAAGLENVAVMPTGGHPVVAADWLHAPGKPTVLIYGHFDVQPVDPLALWTSPPFEPVVRDGRIFARGASDMKGNLLATVVGVEALLRSDGALPVNVRFLVEGQEEIGSPQIPAFLAAKRDAFACDLAVSADALQWTETQPSLAVACRGLCGLQIDAAGANSDLHSGVYGGLAPNPLQALAAILASTRGPRGEILVEGFYDEVVPLSEADRAAIAEVPFDELAYRQALGVPALDGEQDYSPLERLWARPTLEVNGLWGGFQGEGVKTVIPNEAHAKLTCRLVASQNPERIVSLIAAHATKHAPPGVKVTVEPLPGRADPYLMPVDYPGNRVAAGVLGDLYGKPPYFVRFGATVPILGLFKSVLGVETVSMGFSLEDERFHAPDEYFRLAGFERAQRAYAMLLRRLGDQLFQSASP